MTNRRRPSAGAIAKEHHVSRTGYDVRAPIKKGGNGSHNWGTGLNDSLEYDTYDARAISPPSVSKLSLVSREEFEKSKQWSNM
ncbi:hypothetical protein IW140_003663 [Coemansia sp. RSA 1813]|nr:hypothetical protein EV178_002628 [Coemansia sp. RSA 1646]KAJ1770728.1 hypothetical protein LPJ74_002931 [Coemansia sp. RSA 1843]KAJ2088787.1 hypothetical protein IW138_003961 [Coemansia sp. RSA 986]KAJ2568674.1 hypothetical protein IW140_003663 [Coemansia sp. RSA 1813]